VWILAPGYRTHQVKVELRPGQTRTLSPRLAADEVADNLVRNPDFRLEWVKPGQPDGWRRDPARADRWTSAVIRVPLERACLVRVTLRPGKSAGVALRWRSNPASTAGSREVAVQVVKDVADMEVKPDRTMVPFEKGVLYLEVLIATPARLAEVVRHVSVRFAGEEGER
jgi:hypothetical protein